MTAPQPATPNVCQQCGKRKQSFSTRGEARRVARVSGGRRLRVYGCGPYFHLTSAPAERTAAIRAARKGSS